MEALMEFDLTTALVHPDRVRTGNGKRVLMFTDFSAMVPAETWCDHGVLFGVLEGEEYNGVVSWYADGRLAYDFSGSREDLALADPDGPDAKGWYARGVCKWKALDMFWAADKAGVIVLVNKEDAETNDQWTRWQPLAPPVA